MMDAQGGVTDASLLNVFNSRDGGKYKNVNSNSYLDQTDPDDQEYATTADLATPVDMKLPQLGRTQVIPLHNGPFENSGVTPALNQDSSIASIGSQNSSSAAAGVAQVGTAATDYESAITARNNAIAGQNTAISGQLTYQTRLAGEADTADKAQADCLQTKMPAILKAGVQPVMPCP